MFLARAAITRSMRGPATSPGSNALTRMFSGPSSIASERVRPTTPHLVAAYGVRMGKPIRPATELMLMMLPPPDARSAGNACRTVWNCEARLMSSVASSSCAVMSAMPAVGPAMPALFTSTSSPPRCASAVCM